MVSIHYCLSLHGFNGRMHGAMRADYFWVSQLLSSARCGASKARLDLIYAILVLKRWLVLAAVHVGMSITTLKRVQFAAVRKWPLLMILTLFVGVGLSTPAKAQVSPVSGTFFKSMVARRFREEVLSGQ